MTTLITLHLGSRQPKRYLRDSDPANPTLHPEQPGEVKCRVKLRLSRGGTMTQRIEEATRAWAMLDHGPAPAWIAGTDPVYVAVLAEAFGGIPVREWQPEAGDD